MKTTLILPVLILSSLISFAQAQPEHQPHAMPAASDTAGLMDHNYVLHFEVVRDGTNVLEAKWITAKQKFKLDLEKPNLKFAGKLSLREPGKAFLEYELTTSGLNDETEKKSGKAQSQTTGQMINSGLFSFLFKSPISYGLNQNATINESAKTALPSTALEAAVLLPLGQPITLLDNGKEIYKLSVVKLN